jgi:hypothetical protein
MIDVPLQIQRTSYSAESLINRQAVDRADLTRELKGTDAKGRAQYRTTANRLVLRNDGDRTVEKMRVTAEAMGPKGAGPGLVPGRCTGKAHDRENLGLGGRRILVSRQWSGKTLSEHKADRATVVRQALLTSGITAPEIDRMAATVTLPAGTPRFVWTDTRPDPITYARVILRSIAERQRWRAQYEAAKAAARPVDNLSATDRPP